MSRQLSPFAQLSGAEKQIRWLEYQSIRLPYVEAKAEPLHEPETHIKQEDVSAEASKKVQTNCPVPPLEVPRTLPSDYNRTKHTQYDAVIARMKQAELQARRLTSHSSQ